MLKAFKQIFARLGFILAWLKQCSIMSWLRWGPALLGKMRRSNAGPMQCPREHVNLALTRRCLAAVLE